MNIRTLISRLMFWKLSNHLYHDSLLFSSFSTNNIEAHRVLLSFDCNFRQWSDAMLSNLLYCQGKVSGSGSTSDLEAEWKKLYPASLLTARWILL